jgi:hypothetical protein
LIQKKPDLRQRCQAGSSRHLFLWSKVILFPLKHTYMFEHLNDLTIVRVSVLDLDNMFVSIRIPKGGRGKAKPKSFPQTESCFTRLRPTRYFGGQTML